MNTFVNPILTLVLAYGYPVIATAILVSSLGIPLPASIILLASGSLTVDGFLNLPILIVCMSMTALVGDIILYSAGKRYGYLLIERIAPKIRLSAMKIHRLDEVLHRWGMWYIFLTRWLLTPIGVPVTLLSGMERYPFRRFVLVAGIGEVVWVSLYACLGYIFGANWSSLVDYLSDVPLLLTVFAIGITSLLFAYRLGQKKK